MSTSPSALFLMLLFFVPSSATYAQSTIAEAPANVTTSDVSPALSGNRYWELSFYAAQTVANPQIISVLSGQHLFLSGVRSTSRLFTTPHLFIAGNLDLKPLALYSRNIPNGRQYTYGGGGSVGLQFALRHQWRWHPFFDVDGGLLAFTQDTPLPNTRRVNMTFDIGPGALIQLRGNNAIRTGIWWFHFSNGDTAPHNWNPAFDGVMLYVSYTYRNFSFHYLH
jgi:hypothetical protein